MITINTKYCQDGQWYQQGINKNEDFIYTWYVWTEYRRFKDFKLQELHVTLERGKRSILFSFVRNARRLNLSIMGVKYTTRTIKQGIAEFCEKFQKFVEQDKEGEKK